MKKILKILSVIILTSVTIANVSACGIFQNPYPPVDVEQRLKDAANLISNNQDPDFNRFLKNDKQKTIADFQELIKENIRTLFGKQKEDFSNVGYTITNLNTEVKINSSTKIELLLTFNDAKIDCAFTATFVSLQDYVNQKIAPYTKDKSYLKLAKNSPNNELYSELKKSGADFTKIKSNFTTETDKGAAFWTRFQIWEASKDKPLLGYLLVPMLMQIFGDKPYTGLTPTNFEPLLFTDGIHHRDQTIIAITGKKKFNNQESAYMTVTLQGQDNKEGVELSGKYSNITIIFQ